MSSQPRVVMLNKLPIAIFVVVWALPTASIGQKMLHEKPLQHWTSMLNDLDWMKRRQASDMLFTCGPLCASPIPDLRKAFANETRRAMNRIYYAQAIVAISQGDSSKDMLEFLMTTAKLGRRNRVASRSAIEVLRYLGPLAKPAAPMLRELGRDRQFPFNSETDRAYRTIIR